MPRPDHDSSHDTTVPYLQVGTITVYAGEDESSVQVQARYYGPWAYVSEHALATGGKAPAKPKSGQARPRTHHLVHRPSGRCVASVAGELAADELARGLFVSCPGFGVGCALGDSPDDGEEIRAMVRAIAEVAPCAVVGGQPARQLVQAMSLAVVTDDLEVIINDGEAAA